MCATLVFAMNSTATKKILIVEDDHDTRVALRQMFETLGLRVETAANGMVALKILNHVKPNLILLDMMMPLMNGPEFLKVKDNHPEFKEIPVIVMSANEDKLKKITEYPYLKKPLDLDSVHWLAQSYLFK